jgi:hypothetical protein
MEVVFLLLLGSSSQIHISNNKSQVVANMGYWQDVSDFE